MFDAKDRRLLQLLSKDARMSWAKLSDAIGLAAPSTTDRVRKLERSGVIRGYHARIDPTRIGYDVLAFVWLSVNAPGSHEAIARWARASRHVLECHIVAGGHDYMLKLLCRDTLELERILRDEIRALPGVGATETSIVLSTAKETFTPAIPDES